MPMLVLVGVAEAAKDGQQDAQDEQGFQAFAQANQEGGGINGRHVRRTENGIGYVV
jgi:hypothetical protein